MTLADISRQLRFRTLAAAFVFGAGFVDVCRAQEPQLDNSSADPECLTVAQSSASTYTISNAACPDQSVLAAIELGGGPLARCFTKKIRTQISIASEAAAPVINYQCIEGAQGCSVEIVRGMFPECHAS